MTGHWVHLFLWGRHWSLAGCPRSVRAGTVKAPYDVSPQKVMTNVTVVTVQKSLVRAPTFDLQNQKRKVFDRPRIGRSLGAVSAHESSA